MSVLVHTAGAYHGDGGWNGDINRDQRGPELWYLHDSQYRWTLQHAWDAWSGE
ncbi:MAG: hypothetical protein O2923_06385 [Verrucomicrobia bacterium]|nr:hypothetical protein [Verrucomicrobiota bacterium]